MTLPCKQGILNDVAIRELCVTPPIEYFEEQVRNFYIPKALAEQAGVTVAKAEELRSIWKPMIAPFEPSLIRTIGPSEEEITRIYAEEAKMRESNVHYESRDAFMIRNKAPGYRQQKVISYGTTSYGYDVRLSPREFKIFTPTNVTEIDPMAFDPACLVDAPVHTDPLTGLKYVYMPAHSYALGHTMEYFHMPRNVLGICLGKSTYARGAVGINATPIEPGFQGTVVLELTNFAPLPVRIYLETGISQFIFFKGEHDCETSYGDRGGKYQGQTGIQLPLI